MSGNNKFIDKPTHSQPILQNSLQLYSLRLLSKCGIISNECLHPDPDVFKSLDLSNNDIFTNRLSQSKVYNNVKKGIQNIIHNMNKCNTGTFLLDRKKS